MATSFSFVDDLLRDYFHYRNFTSTTRSFDNELSKLPFEHYRADQIIEQLTLDIHQFELNSLIDYWTQIEQHLLSTLKINPSQLLSVSTKIRHYLYKCYLIHAVQSARTDKVNEFFEKLNKNLQQSNEWTKEWFALPFISNPEDNVTFRVYFSKQWNEVFWISVQNFLSMAFFHMTPSKIGSVDEKNSSPTSIKEQTQSSAPTIISKLRQKFLPDTKSTDSNSTSSVSNTSQSIFVEPYQESTIGNQIFLTKDESSRSKSTTIS
ncbi:unnamed protein product [Adineta ricciae]|uniref:ARMC9 CTLH-like domain-containing protein n=1 Tax=Adineta ricciae TaxID=249248 RepID=A0A813PLY0_ADIRI|nr:unnamed protein product [Adineta ricciae]